MTRGKVWHYPDFVRLFHTSTPLRSVELSKEWQRVHDWGKVRQYPYFVRLFHTSTPLRSVELSKEWQRVHDWGNVWHYPYFVRLFHTSTPLRSVELSKEWQVVLRPGEKCDYSTLLHIWEVWNLGWERKVGLFHTSTRQTSVELRMKNESRDLVASAGHLWKRTLRSSSDEWCGVGLARALFPPFRCVWRTAKFSYLKTGNPIFFL